MKTLSLHQPHAQLCVIDRGDGKAVKQIETRSWKTKYRGPLVIHAGARQPQDGQRIGPWEVYRLARTWLLHDLTLQDVELPLGAVVGSVRLVDVVPIIGEHDELPIAWQPHVAPTNTGALWLWMGPSETENLSTGRPTWLFRDITDQLPYGDFTPGRYAWIFEDAKPAQERCPACWGEMMSTAENEHCCGDGIGCYNCDGTRCPVCKGEIGCDPIAVKGKQGIWEWEPAA